MNISNIGIIVDGPTEQGALEKIFSIKYNNQPQIRYSSGNGISYSVNAYAEGVIPTIIYLLNSNTYSIILIPDLEKREKKGITTIDKFAEDIKNTIIQKILQKGKFNKDNLEENIFVCPSNIMFENWIVSDVEGIKKSGKIKNDIKQNFFDGKNGSKLLNDMMISGKYKKTVHAKDLFKYVDENNGIKYSPSYKMMIETLNNLIAIP